MTTVPAVWAVLPVKNTVDAKQRLAGVLTAEHRRGLFVAMLTDVLGALAGAKSLAGIVVVTRDDEATALAHSFGAEVAGEPANDGHTAAVTRGAGYVSEQGRNAILALPGDIPTLKSAEVDTLITSLGSTPAFSIAPSSDKFGSNGIAVSPPGLIEFAFGDDSFRPHLTRARAAGVVPRVLELPGFALDVDRPDDLTAFAAQPSATTAYEYLRREELLGRLAR
jgi:2-phospho-L-lactate/phosphoenolpyruvate guanylyltransferase